MSSSNKASSQKSDHDSSGATESEVSESETTAPDRLHTTRRGIVAALVGGGTVAAGFSPIEKYVDRIAPLSGQAWRKSGRESNTVRSPHGAATVTYDDQHTPLIEADAPAPAYFALGYTHASDRLFQMDLVRRQASGRLAEVVGPPGVERDVFFRKLDLERAAAASEKAIEGTETSRVLNAYADGINAFIEEESPGTEFGLLGYEPDAWTVLDTFLVLGRFGWRLSGQFTALRRSVIGRTFDDPLRSRLYPIRFDHDAPIIRDGDARKQVFGPPTEQEPVNDEAVDQSFIDWLGQFEPPDLGGSNAWTIPGDYTDTGAPIVASDPHMGLRAPPVLYEQQVSIEDRSVGGVTAAGLPFVVIGENDHGAWGLTNAGNVDVLDIYTYEVDGDRYRYRGEWLEFESETQTISVARGDDRTVDVRKTVHGPFIERTIDGEQRHVGVAWTFLTGTRELEGLYELGNGFGAEQFEDAIRKIDGLPLNFHYADHDGNTGYALTGKIPIRRVDGDEVHGNRVFNGSTGEGEWDGFDPYGQSTWDGFVPFEEKPSVRNVGYIASANQKLTVDRRYAFAGQGAQGFRAERIYERLDRAAEAGQPMDADFVKDVQLDTLDLRARRLVPQILDARDAMPDRAGPWLDALERWDYRMKRDSRAALVFIHFARVYPFVVWSQFFEDYDLGPRYWPKPRVLLDLPPESEVFGGNRAALMADAMGNAIDQIEKEGWRTYGNFNQTVIKHPLGSLEPGLNYPRLPSDGSGRTIRAVFGRGGFGSSYRMVADLGGETSTVLPGGNDGAYGSAHYHDQLRTWVEGGYTALTDDRSGTPDITFDGGPK